MYRLRSQAKILDIYSFAFKGPPAQIQSQIEAEILAYVYRQLVY